MVNMFVDTQAANKSSRPRITISPQPTSHYDESTTPLLETFVGQDAPPSYLEATTPGLWNGRPSGDEGAGLLSYEREVEGGEGAELYKRRGSTAGYRRRSLREQCTKKKWLKWLAAILLLIVLAAIMAALAARGDTKTAVTPAPAPSAQLAETDPKPTPAQPAPPVKSKANFPIRWPAHCGKEYNTKSEEYDFGVPTELNIQEAVHQLDGPYKRVSGWIHVAQAPDSQAEGTVQAKLAYAISSSVDVHSVKYASAANGLTIGDPSFPDGFDGVRPGTACMGISVVLYMARGATLTNLNIASTHLGMQVHQGVEFSVTNSTSISLTTGTLDSVSFNSRETHLETISGSISGKYSLFDLVSIKTISGSVNVNIEPKEAVHSSSQPAVFQANSLSGSIRADFERKRIPERDYQVWINTTVGSVDGTFIHGSKTVINSVAGLVNADLLPFKAGGSASTIDTTNDSGQSSIIVQSPYKAKGVLMTGLTSVHKSVSGAIELVYPQEWQGHLEGSSSNGTLHLQGRDLELIKQEEEPGKNYVEAKKGANEGASTIMFKTVSGACDVKVGKI